MATILFVRWTITKKFNYFKNILESVILGNSGMIQISSNDEFGEIAELLNKIVSLINKNKSTNDEYLKKIKDDYSIVVSEIQKNYANNIVAILDAENKFVFVPDSIEKITKSKKEILANIHILDIAELKHIIPTIQESLKNPYQKIYFKSLEFLRLAGTDGKIIGTIIAFKI